MKQQVFLIHGGDAFDTYEEYIADLEKMTVTIEGTLFEGWKPNLKKSLADVCDVILPRMPNPQNARYKEWKIMFEKFVPQFGENIIFIGHSLGAVFLAKWLSEEKYSKKILATILVAAPYFNSKDYPFVDFNIEIGLSGLQEQGGEIILYQSKDDLEVPFSSFERYQKELPNATTRIFVDRQHFNQAHLPELEEDVRRLILRE
ncbi:MAG: serine hydrolase [Patescibacteria group bacterium]|nr:serine hydrolase [Patescibacteria group bacterium]